MEPSKTCCCELGADCPDARHVCEPPDYPQETGREWTCGDCGRVHETFRVDTDPSTPDFVKKHMRGETWGWRSRAIV